MTDTFSLLPNATERRVRLACSDHGLALDVESECRRLGHRVERVDRPEPPGDDQPAAVSDLVLLEQSLLGSNLESILQRWSLLPEAPAVILLSQSTETHAAYDLLDRGVTDVIHLPLHPRQLALRLTRALEVRDLGLRLAGLEDAISERSRHSFASRTVVAESPAMRRLAVTLERVAPMRTTVLVLGESGVGKELVARSVHFRSPRHDAPFIAINCAALPQHLIESELFGHERGSFTGAIARRAGKFELAHRGTLFLDEIGETDMATQAKLLRVLEHQEFMRVGGSHTVRVDVRLIAATNADLERLVRSGRFREDLYYRLKVVTLSVPPLRERREDIPRLAEMFLKQLCRANSLRPRHLTAAAMEALARYGWPGNVRELVNALEAVLVSTPTEEIDLVHLPSNIQGHIAETPHPRAMAGHTLRDMEAEAIRSTLSAAGGSRTRAAELLGIGVRTLRRRIQELGLQELMPPKPGRPRRKRE
ncbi:MAG: sigma-54 dependent transcriptional regulator [Acidobacteriota bacterium]